MFDVKHAHDQWRVPSSFTAESWDVMRRNAKKTENKTHLKKKKNSAIWMTCDKWSRQHQPYRLNVMHTHSWIEKKVPFSNARTHDLVFMGISISKPCIDRIRVDLSRSVSILNFACIEPQFSSFRFQSDNGQVRDSLARTPKMRVAPETIGPASTAAPNDDE